MPGVVPARRLPTASSRPSERTGPDPSLLQGVGASFWAAAYDDGGSEIKQRQALDKTYDDLADDLARQGFDASGYRRRLAQDGFATSYDEDAIWRDVDRARARDPKAFAGIPATRELLNQSVTAPVVDEVQRVTDRAARAGGAASMIGRFGYDAGDPVNTVGLVVGAGAAKSVAQAVLNEAIFNARLTAFEQPVEAIDRAKKGKELTAGEAATNVVMGGVVGGLFGGVAKGVELHAGPAIGNALATARERTIAGVWDRLPEAVRQRWASATAVKPEELLDLAEMVIGRDRMSEDEKAAAQVILRETAIARSNPFVANGAGIAAHQEGLADALGRALNNVPPARSRLTGTTSLTPPTPGVSPVNADVIFASLVTQESRGQRGIAGPMTKWGQAHGLTQVLDSTAEQLAGRLGVAWRPDLMRGASDEAAAYQLKIGRAYFDEGLRRYGGDVRQALMFYHGGPDRAQWGPKTHAYADQIVARAGGGEVRLRPDVAPGNDVAQLQGELDRLRAERVELATATHEDTPIEASQPDMAGSGPDQPMPADPLPDAAIPAWRGEPVEAQADTVLPQLRTIVDDRSRSLNNHAALARELGVSEDVVRSGLTSLALDGRVRQKRNGQFARMPRTDLPIDALKFIARRGLRDDIDVEAPLREGHDLAKGRGLDIFVPGAGKLIRRGGTTIDAMGEQLWEAGYFGPTEAVDRPDTSDVLDLIERAAHGEKIYSAFDEADVAARDAERRDVEQRRDTDLEREAYRDAADGIEFHVDDELIDHAMRRYGDMDRREGLIRALEDAFDDAQLDVAHERDEGFAGYDDDHAHEPIDRETGAGAQMGGGRGADAGDASESRAAGALDGQDDSLSLPVVDRASVAAFDDPDAMAAKAQVDSLDHDLRAAIDPVIADRQRQKADLRAASPMRAGTDQDSMIGAPLFDAMDQLQLDVDAPPVTLTDLLAAQDEEQAAIDALRSCL